MSARLLLPTDFSAGSEHGVRTGGAIAKELGARVTLLHVLDTDELDLSLAPLSGPQSGQGQLLREAREAVWQALDEARPLVPAGVEVDTVLIEAGHEARAISDYASAQGYDLVVLATHGRTGLRRFLVGSVAEKVVRLCRVDVVTVPVPADVP